MKSILTAAPVEVGAIKRRTIRSLAMGDITQGDCDYIIKQLDNVTQRVELINKKRGDDDGRS